MKKTLLLLLLFAFWKSHCQKSTLISYEIASGYDYVNFNSSGQNILNTASGIPMFILTQQLNKHFYVETGIASDYIEYIVGRDSLDDNGVTFYKNETQIPLRIQYREHFFNEKYNIYLLTGINYSIGSAKEKNLIIANDAGVTEFKINRNYLLGQIGIGMEYIINRHLFVGARYQYDFGFEDSIKIKGFTNSNMPFTINSKANSSVIGVYFGYKLSNLWNKSKSK